MILTTDDGGVSWKKSPPETHAPGAERRGSVRRQWYLSGRSRRSKRLVWNRRGGCLPRVSNRRPRSNLDRPRDADRGGQSVRRVSSRWRFATQNDGVAVGGDYKSPEQANRVVATTADGGRTWTLPKGQGPGGYRSAVALCTGLNPTNTGRGWSHRVGSLDATAARHGRRWERWAFTLSASRARSTAGWGAGDDGIDREVAWGATLATPMRARSIDHGHQADPSATASRRIPRGTLFLIAEAFRLDGKGTLEPTSTCSRKESPRSLRSFLSTNSWSKLFSASQTPGADVQCR